MMTRNDLTKEIDRRLRLIGNGLSFHLKQDVSLGLCWNSTDGSYVEVRFENGDLRISLEDALEDDVCVKLSEAIEIYEEVAS